MLDLAPIPPASAQSIIDFASEPPSTPRPVPSPGPGRRACSSTGRKRSTTIVGEHLHDLVLRTVRDWNLSTDILVAMQRQFFDRWSALAPLPDEPAIYAVNHQVACDLGFLCWPLAFATPFRASVLVSRTASESQHGKLINGLVSHPRHHLEDPRLQFTAIPFDPSRPKRAVGQTNQHLETESVIASVEGKVQSRDEQPVKLGSSLLPNLAIRTGRPIVPVRISGGLPSEPSHFRVFPHDYQGIRVVSGEPIAASELKALSPGHRTRRVLGAVNELIGRGPEPRARPRGVGGEEPFAEAVAERQIRTGSSAVKCAVTELLMRGPARSEASRGYLELFEPKTGTLPSSLDTEWDRSFVHWLSDGLNMPEGPEKYEWLCAR